MMLMTKEIKKKIPKLYATEHQTEEEKIVHVKFFMPSGSWTWYGIEFDGKDEFFGYVKGFANELGYFSLKELKSIKGAFGLGVERDLSFKPVTLSQIKREG